jgi:hypothetical protein
MTSTPTKTIEYAEEKLILMWLHFGIAGRRPDDSGFLFR